ncbi:MAG: hypothetical protein U1F43_26355 [Myxococcota bacterium]
MLSLATGATSTRASAPQPLAFPASDADLDADGVDAVAFIGAQGAVARTLSPRAREAIEAAFADVQRAFADPRVQALLAAKRDWVVAADGAWARDAGVGPAWVAALTTVRPLASLVSYGQVGSAEASAIVDPGMRAFVLAGSRVIALHQSFLDAALDADAAVGARMLARTLTHELAHVLGYDHPDGLDAVASEAYADSVPVFVGCIAQLYPDLDAVRRACGSHAPAPMRSW